MAGRAVTSGRRKLNGPTGRSARENESGAVIITTRARTSRAGSMFVIVRPALLCVRRVREGLEGSAEGNRAGKTIFASCCCSVGGLFRK